MSLDSTPDQEWKNNVSQQVTLLLQKVKARLMSRELEQQREAILWLCNELSVDSVVGLDLFVEILLKSEIIVLLCETTMTIHGPLVTCCFAGLTQSERFYKHNHASYVVASILQTGHFLTLQEPGKKDEDKIVMLKCIVDTLEKIFKGATNFRVSTNKICDLQQLFKFLDKLLSDKSFVEQITFPVAKILSIVLKSTRVYDIVKDVENGALVVELVRTTLNLMRQVIEAEDQSNVQYTFRAMAMMCTVCAAGISSALDRGVNETDLPFPAYRENLAACIISSIMKTVIPKFTKLDFDKKYVRFYTSFVSCLNGIYDLECCNTKDLSNHLAEQGYLQILSILSTFVGQNLRSDILLLLSRILTTLASVSLSATTWLGGTKQFQRFLLNAFNSLPLDPSTWPSCLKEGDDRADALLVFFYYYFLAEITDAAAYLPVIVSYVVSSAGLKTKRRSTTILKALWFIFCISAVCHENPSEIHSYDSATNRIFEELESVDFAQCYTHHPSVVVYCLRTIIVSDRLRLDVVRLWLEGGGDVGCFMNDTVNRLSMNQCLMELIRTGSPRTIDMTLKAMSKALVDNVEGVEGFIELVWEVLPRILASRDKESAHNTESVLKLTSMFEPKGTSGIALVRSLYQLIRFVVENEDDLTLVPLGVRSAYHLLQLCIRRKDVQGITMFTKEPRLIGVLKTLAFRKENPVLSHISFHCLGLLIKHQGKYAIECEESLEIKVEDLLEQLRVDGCQGALELVGAIFSKRIEKPVIELRGISSGSNCDWVMVDLYLQVHNTHAKSVPDDRNLSYILLVGLLNHCGSMTTGTRLLKILCEQPWTYCLIKMTIAESRGFMDSDFMNFISTWLFHRYATSTASETSNDRALCKDQFETILDLIGKAALSSFKKNPKKELLSKLVHNLLLFQGKLTESIGNELLEVDEQLNKD